jgi:cation transport ATPase
MGKAVSGNHGANRRGGTCAGHRDPQSIERRAERVPTKSLNVGDMVLVKPGSKIPLDGVVTDETAACMNPC